LPKFQQQRDEKSRENAAKMLNICRVGSLHIINILFLPRKVNTLFCANYVGGIFAEVGGVSSSF